MVFWHIFTASIHHACSSMIPCFFWAIVVHRAGLTGRTVALLASTVPATIMELPPPVDDTGRPLTKPNGGAAPGRMTALLPPAVEEEEEDEMPSLPAVGISRATNKRLAAPSQQDDQCGLPLPQDAQDCCSFWYGFGTFSRRGSLSRRLHVAGIRTGFLAPSHLFSLLAGHPASAKLPLCFHGRQKGG